MGGDAMTRRRALAAGAAALALPSGLLAGAREGGELRFRLAETAGLRRFGYPVHAVLPGVRMGNHFRLARGDRVVPAQFRAVDGPDGGPAVALDFNASPGPLATEDYTITYGDDLAPGPEPKQALRVEHVEGAFRVSSGSSLRYEVPDDLLGFLRGVENARHPFLRGRSEGLLIRGRGDTYRRVGGKGPGGEPARGSVTRQGPMAIGLRFEGAEDLGEGRSVRSAATLTFPSSKSWVEASWTVDDPEGWVGGLGVDLDLAIEGAPTLVDLGAGSIVYGQLKGGERMELRAGEAPGLPAERAGWAVLKGPAEAPEPFALPPKGGPGAPAEGWAHVMDASRCTALAVAGFGRSARDRIEVDAAGRVRLRRDFAGGGAAPPPGPKTWTFWFHFVTMPVQVGAATSPQAMLAPLQLTWEAG